MSNQVRCIYCDKEGDLRPYGPNGAYLCFKCLKSTPERQRDAESQFSNQLYHCGNVAVATKNGPVPYKRKPQ